ncbi:hypothetical protein PENTCL1PPCAC_6419, partial [Pristionchus entomophagus]
MDRSTPEGRGTSLSPISTVDGDVDRERVPLLSPLPSSDGLGSHITIDMSDGDGKPVKTKVKRKDTATSPFTNFFQRFSRSSAEIKIPDDHHRLERGEQPLLEEEETVFIERPDTLQIPDEEQWFESRTSFDVRIHRGSGWTTAMEPRMTAIIDETRVKPMTPYPDGTKLESNEEMQKALEVLLEDFRSGKMGGLSDVQMSQLDATRRAHERITDTHRQLASEAWMDTMGEKEETALRESYNRMYDCGISMSDSVHPPSPSGPSLPALDTAAAPAESSSNAVAAAAAVADAVSVGSAVSIPSLSMASSSAPSPSQSSSSQPSPSPSGGAAKYENTKELKTLKEKIANLGAKGNFSEQVEVLRSSEATLIKYYPLLEEFLISLDPLHSTAAIVLALAVMVEGATAKKQDRDMMRASDILKNFVESKVLVKEQLLMVIDI